MTAYAAQRTSLQYGDGATPELYTDIAAVTSITGPSFSNPTIDVSNLDSTARAKISSGIVDGQQVKIDVIFDALPDAIHDVLVDRVIAGTGPNNYCVSLGDLSDTSGQATVSAVDTVTEKITTAAAHSFHTGQAIVFASTLTVPPPLVAGTVYYARHIDADEITVHTTNAGAVANTGMVNLSGEGTGTITIRRGGKIIFPGIVTEATPAAGLGEAITGTLTFDVTGAVTINL